jgi:hypothetical protein
MTSVLNVLKTEAQSLFRVVSEVVASDGMSRRTSAMQVVKVGGV